MRFKFIMIKIAEITRSHIAGTLQINILTFFALAVPQVTSPERQIYQPNSISSAEETGNWLCNNSFISLALGLSRLLTDFES